MGKWFLVGIHYANNAILENLKLVFQSRWLHLLPDKDTAYEKGALVFFVEQNKKDQIKKLHAFRFNECFYVYFPSYFPHCNVSKVQFGGFLRYSPSVNIGGG